MGFNDEQEISAEQESEIVSEFFPELMEASELNSERGRSLRGGGSNRWMGRSSYTRRPMMAGHYGRQSSYRRRQWPMRGYGYSDYSNTSPGGMGMQDLSWAQACLAQIVGPWVQQSGRYDSTTRRAIRIFQSRSGLRPTGRLDHRTRAALRQACGQQAAPGQGTYATPPPAPAVDTAPPDAGPEPAPAPDDAGPDNAPPPDGAPQQEYFRRRHMYGNRWNQSAGIAPPFSDSFEQESWEGEAPSQPGQGTQLTCQLPLVLDGFRTGDYTIRRQHYAKLIALLPQLPAPIIVIRGHTDNQGDATSNAGLSASRAFEVQQWLTLSSGGKAIAGQILIDALGATSPVASNATEAGRSRNRRVEIFVCQSPPPPPLVAGTKRITLGGKSVAEFGPAEISMEAPAAKDWYYIDAWRMDTGTPQKIKSLKPWQDTAQGAALLYDGLCGQFQSSDPSQVIVRCYIWAPVSGWIPCKNSVGFPKTAFCGRLDKS